ncbi:cobalamin-dependent protein [Blautia sp.]|jgi:corrinoid protein of di/trimethylamine methyltransferase|uniref:cobalamin-dependent protein n=1 Tax=Blautia sp. TaxID=1955243 RepID=UPI003D9414E5
MIIIGEKLNGSIPSVAKAIADKDAELIKERARKQAEAGATFLDVCASVEEDVEVETLKWMINLVQEVTDTPICVDSPSAKSCVAAIPFCKRPGLVNSVSLEGDKIDTIFPVIADTDWECVALLCDNDGIPDSVERRMKVFHGIMDKAKEYGIAPSRLHIDPLVVTLSTDETALTVFADCCRQIKAEYPEIHITSGLSNISFGLPVRKNINQAFMVLAMNAGMDSAIVDPTNKNMIGMIYATDALLERDEYCLNYIGKFQDKPAEAETVQTPQTPADEKMQAVFKATQDGKNKEIGKCVQDAIDAGCDPTAILNDGMIGAMAVVGENFKKEIIFVPQMLAAARAMKAGVEVLKPYLATGEAGSAGKIILGTVAGDLHDIGKNLVGMMFESAGFEVLDLGVDVPIQTFIDTVNEHKDATIVALSALLTTTMPSLRDTVAALLEQPFRSRIKIMVGGAPITQEFADEIGADAYTEDAASAAEQAKKYADSGFCAKAAAGEFDLSEEELKAFKEKKVAEKTETVLKEENAAVKEKEVQVNFDKTKVDISKVKLPKPGEGYKLNWEETKEKFRNYWAHKNTGRPLMCVIARRPEIEQYSDGTPVDGGYLGQICQGKYYNMPDELMWKDMEDKYQDPQRIVDRYRFFCDTHAFLGESFPNLNVDFGPGSLAAYLGSEIGFKEDTVWFNKCLDGWDGVPKLAFDPENKWFKKHINLVKNCRQLAGNDFYVDMPDLMENIDVLASLRGAQETLFDLLDEPEKIGERIQEVTDVYYQYYDRFYDAIKDDEGGNAYTVFQIWGPGRTVKLQCDFSAMMSPDDFRTYIQPSLKKQSENVDHVLYHLDGPQAIKHMDALMEIDGIDALQWTSGDAGPDGTLPDWDVIYDKAIAAGKSIWVKVYSGEFEDWIRNVDRLVKKYGSHSLFLLFPEMSMEQAVYLLDYAEKHWSDVKGTFCESLGR